MLDCDWKLAFSILTLLNIHILSSKIIIIYHVKEINVCKKRFSFSFKLKFLLFSMSFLVSRCFKARKDYKHYWEILFIRILFKPELAPVLLELPVHHQQSPLYPQPLPQMLSLLSCLNRSMTLPWKTIILESSLCILRPLFFLATPLPLPC